MERVFISGGAGFIGSALAWRLAPLVQKLVIFDNLHPQVHGGKPPILPPSAHVVEGDVRDAEALHGALLETDPDVIFHLAAETGTAQSHEVPTRYCSVNVTGVTHLVEALRTLPSRPRRVVLTSSRAIYGEGAYLTPEARRVVPDSRRLQDLSAQRFDLYDPQGRELHAVPTCEYDRPKPASIYASTKLMQELVLNQALEGSPIEAVTLRLQNVFGPGQSLKNPYTGVLSIFADQILRGQNIDIYEDGNIVRDFIYIDDVIDALVEVASGRYVGSEPLNIGTGVASTIETAARIILLALKASTNRMAVSGRFRIGDVRHAVADVSQATTKLLWRPRTSLETGLGRLANWAQSQHHAVTTASG